MMKTNLYKISLTVDSTKHRLSIVKYEVFIQKKSYLIHRLDNYDSKDIQINFSKLNKIDTNLIERLSDIHNYYTWSLEENIDDNVKKLKEHIVSKVTIMYNELNKQLSIINSIEFLNDKGEINEL